VTRGFNFFIKKRKTGCPFFFFILVFLLIAHLARTLVLQGSLRRISGKA
jgi:hypothetical protein